MDITTNDACAGVVAVHFSQAPHTENVVTGMTPVRSNCDVLANGTGEILQMLLLLLDYV